MLCSQLTKTKVFSQGCATSHPDAKDVLAKTNNAAENALANISNEVDTDFTKDQYMVDKLFREKVIATRVYGTVRREWGFGLIVRDGTGDEALPPAYEIFELSLPVAPSVPTDLYLK